MSMMMLRLHHYALAAAVACGLANPAAAQFGATPPLPSDTFRKAPLPISPPQPVPPQPVPPQPAKPSATQPPTPAKPTVTVFNSSDPTYDEGAYARTGAALQTYTAIAGRGGWPQLPRTAQLGPGVTAPEVAILRQRLVVTGDLPASAASGDTYDNAVTAGVRRFQGRHGLTETGSVGPLTLNELNVPAAARVRALSASLDRLANTSFPGGQRYVIVNIPGAYAEAISNGRVERRYVAVVGKADRQSPVVASVIGAVNLNPTWTVPLSIVKKDIVPKMRRDPSYLARMHMRVLDGAGNEIDPASIDWHSDRAFAFTIRQDPGKWNALGELRIDMPNAHSVYMHDTNHRNLFSSDQRFHSSGCARIADPRSLAAWLLQDTSGWGRAQIDAGIAGGQRIDARLARGVPVAWIYLTGWQTRDGTIHFRPDVYDHDDTPAKPFMVSLPKAVASAAPGSGFTLQSADTRSIGEEKPLEFRQVSNLDEQ